MCMHIIHHHGKYEQTNQYISTAKVLYMEVVPYVWRSWNKLGLRNKYFGIASLFPAYGAQQILIYTIRNQFQINGLFFLTLKNLFTYWTTQIPGKTFLSVKEEFYFILFWFFFFFFFILFLFLFLYIVLEAL